MEFRFVLLMCFATASICSARKGVKVDKKKRRSDSDANIVLSKPEECSRTCRDGEPPKTCYYHFTMEMYNSLGEACKLENRTGTNAANSESQCVLVDGIARGVLTVNRKIPGPSIEVCEGDGVVIDVLNKMHGVTTTIHWHGVFQNGYQYYDGVSSLTQCPISEGTTFRYQWKAANAGTHFWHSHQGFHKLDGLYGSVIVRQPQSKDPSSYHYDEDLSAHVIQISDWMHEDSSQRFPGLLVGKTSQAAENVLINGMGQFTDPDTGSTTDTPLAVFTVTPGRRYRFRLINSFATVCPADIVIEKHSLTVIATDGEPVRPVKADSIVSFSGERYDFVINADQPIDAYWIQLRAHSECSAGQVQNLGILRYEGGPDQPRSEAPTYDKNLPLGITVNPLDGICDRIRSDAICVSQLETAKGTDRGILERNADVKIYLPYEFYFYELDELFAPNTYKTYLDPAGSPLISLVDGISFEFPPSPPLTQNNDLNPEQFCNGDNRPPDCGPDCKCTHQYDIPLNAIVEIIFFDRVPQPTLAHPFHLHGYAFSVIGMGSFPDTDKNTTVDLQMAVDMDKRGLLKRTNTDSPPRKDTIAVPTNGYTIIRFRADNPGYWLFHCHFTFHLAIGMAVVLHVGEQSDLPPIPPNFPTCGDFLPPIVHFP